MFNRAAKVINADIDTNTSILKILKRKKDTLIVASKYYEKNLRSIDVFGKKCGGSVELKESKACGDDIDYSVVIDITMFPGKFVKHVKKLIDLGFGIVSSGDYKASYALDISKGKFNTILIVRVSFLGR